MTVAITGLLALASGAIQAQFLPDPEMKPVPFIYLWAGLGALSILITGVEMIARTRRIHGGFADDMLYAAVEQFIPATVAGALLTFVIGRFAPEAMWMLPGLWQIVFALGVFASMRALPRGMFGVGVWYLAAGLVTLATGRDTPFSPLAMAIPFGVGQLLMAFMIYRATGGDDGEE